MVKIITINAILVLTNEWLCCNESTSKFSCGIQCRKDIKTKKKFFFSPNIQNLKSQKKLQKFNWLND